MPIIHHYNGIARKVIGTLNPDRKEFSKKVSTSKHLLKKLDAWGIDGDFFTDVLVPNNYLIKITDIESHVRYWVQAPVFAKHATFLHFKSGIVDHGAQAFLPRRYWEQETYDPLNYVRRTPWRVLPGIQNPLEKVQESLLDKTK